VRAGLIAFGWLNVGLGVVGMFLPVMPTTVFLLIALWAFSKSSKRLHDWLYSHPRLGPNLRAWQDHRVIPRRAKILAVAMMAGSFLYLAFYSDLAWPFVAAVGFLLATIAGYILTRPSIAKAQPADR
jgi:uncharacterized membrane protein YbaN (DUF454 family)